MGAVCSVIFRLFCGIAVAFFTTSGLRHVIMSREDIQYPPISVVLANTPGAAHLEDCMISAIRSKKESAVENVSRQLSDLGKNNYSG